MQNIVVIAAGGGNDIFSAIAYINSQLKNKNYPNYALLGILGLTPFHTNEEMISNSLNIEHPIIVPSANMKRYLVMHPPKQIYATESLLPEIIESSAPYIKHYACISPKYSAIEQADNINKLLQSWGFYAADTIINIVDFGGDILSNGKQSTIISPELDAFTLAVVRNMTQYKSYLSVCFPGVDGELDNEYLREMCEQIAYDGEDVNVDLWKQELEGIYNKIKHYRAGNTIPNMLKVIDGEKLVNINKYVVIGKQRYNINSQINIDINLQSRIYYFDIKFSNPYVNIFNSDSYDLMELLKHINSIYSNQCINDNSNQMSDLFLQYLRPDVNGLYTNKHLIINDSDNIQKVIYVNILPYQLRDNSECLTLIKELTTYDDLYLSD